MHRCDGLFPSLSRRSTYSNDALHCESNIDFFLANDTSCLLGYEVIDPAVNLSDHLPITADCKCLGVNPSVHSRRDKHTADTMKVTQLRWDYADLALYCNTTGFYLQPLVIKLKELHALQNTDSLSVSEIDLFYENLINYLSSSANIAVPTHTKNYFKFWWDQELDELKQLSIASCQIWKSHGKPRSGHVFDKYRKDKSEYRRRIRFKRINETTSYTNDLHDALINKQGATFWKCWKDKFGRNKQAVSHVDGSADHETIVDKFADHFSKVCSNLTVTGAARLKNNYENIRAAYCGAPDRYEYFFDAELVENIISNMSRGKAAGLDGLSAEHLQYCHPLLPGILANLFNLMILCGHVPTKFGQSYTVPIPKVNNAYNKSLIVEDFRGISISCVLSKIFEHCILDRYRPFFVTSDNQFGFKKNSGCSHAIYTLRCAVDHYTSRGSTVNLGALDLSKAFDKMNHYGLFIKLMEKCITKNLLIILENWFASCLTCVKWGCTFSSFFTLTCGIRQGGVLSPYLFALYVDGIIERIRKEYLLGCHIGWQCLSIMLYADDIIIIAPSVVALEKLLLIVEHELEQLDMEINARKSMCIRIGPRFSVPCASIFTTDGRELQWLDSICYLGVTIISATSFTCSFTKVKQSFYVAFNSIFGKIGRMASEEVILELVKKKCMPALLYGLDACPITTNQINSLQFAVTGMLMKLFNTRSKSVITECIDFFDFQTVAYTICKRKLNFLLKYSVLNNSLCQLFSDIADKEYYLNYGIIIGSL